MDVKRTLYNSITVIALFAPVLLDGLAGVRSTPGGLADLSIYDVQYTEEPSGDSPYAGQEVSLRGVVTGVFPDGYFIAEAPGAWHAIYVYSIQNGPRLGDEVSVRGVVQEFYGLTEIHNVTDYQLHSSGNSLLPVTLTAGSAAQEMYESVLVRLENVTVTGLEDYGEWLVSDGTAGLRCDDLNDYMYFPRVGDTLDGLAGVLFYSFEAYKLEPRGTSDIRGDVIPHYALRGDIVTMNAQREVFPGAYLEVLGDRIVAIHSSQPGGIPLVDSQGLIFPGLIDAHNHPLYDVLDLIPFEERFEERYEWQDDPLYAAFKDQFHDILDYGGDNAQRTNLVKLAEVRALTAGTTTIQGFNASGHAYDGFARQGIGINNAERFPNRIYSEVFPLEEEASFWEQKGAEYWERFVIHLSEGVTQAALDEFYAWKDMGMLDARTTIIHGVPYSAAEWAHMASAGASLVWSPWGNLRLYGASADVPGALGAGVNVALAPDWTESGSLNLLDELRVANAINQANWGGAISPLQLAEFVTRNAARALGAEGRVGQIEPGYLADLVVIPGEVGDPYSALLAAKPRDVKLTIVNGRPMYGDPALMEQFPFLSGREEIRVGGASKQLAIQIQAHAIPDSDVAFSEILSELEEAYALSDLKVCAFLGIERDLPVRVFLPLLVRND